MTRCQYLFSSSVFPAQETLWGVARGKKKTFARLAQNGRLHIENRRSSFAVAYSKIAVFEPKFNNVQLKFFLPSLFAFKTNISTRAFLPNLTTQCHTSSSHCSIFQIIDENKDFHTAQNIFFGMRLQVYILHHSNFLSSHLEIFRMSQNLCWCYEIWMT